MQTKVCGRNVGDGYIQDDAEVVEFEKAARNLLGVGVGAVKKSLAMEIWSAGAA